MNEAGRCPVCQARFRGAGICSRCGADLGRLMVLAAQAWWLREAARRAVEAADFERASALATSAQQAQSTEAGEVLRRLSQWLAAGPYSHRCC